MPAAAVIPAPRAYTNIAVVKTLVVGCWVAGLLGGSRGSPRSPVRPRGVRGVAGGVLCWYNPQQYVPAPVLTRRCEWLLLQVSFSGDRCGCIPNACVLTPWGARPLAPCILPSVHHRSPLSQTPWKTQCAQSVHLGWMTVHGMSQHRPDMAMELCWPWCLSWGTWLSPQGLRRHRLPDGAHPGRWRAGSIGYDGTARGERYCNARGEILRPLQDPLQRRRSASARSSIKNVSVGSEDDQTPS